MASACRNSIRRRPHVPRRCSSSRPPARAIRHPPDAAALSKSIVLDSAATRTLPGSRSREYRIAEAKTLASRCREAFVERQHGRPTTRVARERWLLSYVAKYIKYAMTLLTLPLDPPSPSLGSHLLETNCSST